MYTSIAGYWAKVIEYTEAWSNAEPTLRPRPPLYFLSLHAWVTMWKLCDQASQEADDGERLRKVAISVHGASVIREMHARYPVTGKAGATGKDTGKDAISLHMETERVFHLYTLLKLSEQGVLASGANGGTRTHTGANPLEPKSK